MGPAPARASSAGARERHRRPAQHSSAGRRAVRRGAAEMLVRDPVWRAGLPSLTEQASERRTGLYGEPQWFVWGSTGAAA